MINKAGIWIEELEQIRKFDDELSNRRSYHLWHGTMDGYEEYKILKYNEEVIKNNENICQENI